MKKKQLFKICRIVNNDIKMTDLARELGVTTQYIYMVLEDPSISPRIAAKIDSFLKIGIEKAIRELKSSLDAA